MTVRKKTRARYKAIAAEKPTVPSRVDPERTYCYCDAWNLTYPHYFAEHTSEHEDAQRLRARRSGGLT